MWSVAAHDDDHDEDAMHSISDLTTFCRKTTGEVPAKLVVMSQIAYIVHPLLRPAIS